MLYVSFVPIGWPDTVWGALVPLIIACIYSRPRVGWWLGLLTGLAWWLPTLTWLLRLSETGWPPVPLPAIGAGWLLISAACAAFCGAFGFLLSCYSCTFGRSRVVATCGAVIGAALVWMGLEYLRGVIFSGFPWHPLAASQYQNPPILQIAEIGGAGLVSGLIVLMNASIALTVVRHIEGIRGRRRLMIHPELMIGLAAVLASLVWGTARYGEIRAQDATARHVRLGAVQLNVGQGSKWDESHQAMIIERLYQRTEHLAVYTDSDLVVWPETALPWIFTETNSLAMIRDMLAFGCPILVGAIDRVPHGDDERFVNSALLCIPGEGTVARYDKRHLVPFGEYVPFGRVLARLTRFSLLGWSCVAGTEATVFRLPLRDGKSGATAAVPFSVLICFEDIFPELARTAVRAGAAFLIVQTNDAWFDPSHASVQHMTHSVLRAVENRVPVFRVANTGVSCAINRAGDIKPLGDDGDLALREFVSAPFSAAVRMPNRATLFSKSGYLVHPVLGLLTVAVILLALWRARRRECADATCEHD